MLLPLLDYFFYTFFGFNLRLILLATTSRLLKFLLPTNIMLLWPFYSNVNGSFRFLCFRSSLQQHTHTVVFRVVAWVGCHHSSAVHRCRMHHVLFGRQLFSSREIVVSFFPLFVVVIYMHLSWNRLHTYVCVSLIKFHKIATNEFRPTTHRLMSRFFYFFSPYRRTNDIFMHVSCKTELYNFILIILWHLFECECVGCGNGKSDRVVVVRGETPPYAPF